MGKTARTSLWESSYVMHWVVNADRLTSAPGESEEGACSSISAHFSSVPLFPSHPGCWCLDGWSSEQLESGTARLPWAFLRQPVPGWLWPSQGTGWPSSPKNTLTPSLPWTVSQFLSSCPSPAPSVTPQAAVRHGRVPQVHTRLSWTLSAFST